ncbi:MAG: hypothetical protein U0X73_17895 [Thermoanaerobaculia bacterium]
MVRKFVGFVVLATALAAPMFGAASLTLAGSTVGQPTFNRPFTDGSALSGHIVPYKVQNFFPNEDSTCFIYGSQSFDGVVFLYDGPFDPLNPLTNLLTADDDGDVGTGSSTIESLNLEFNHNYVLRVEDGLLDHEKHFINTLGHPANAVTDIFALPCH